MLPPAGSTAEGSLGTGARVPVSKGDCGVEDVSGVCGVHLHLKWLCLAATLPTSSQNHACLLPVCLFARAQRGWVGVAYTFRPRISFA